MRGCGIEPSSSIVTENSWLSRFAVIKLPKPIPSFKDAIQMFIKSCIAECYKVSQEMPKFHLDFQLLFNLVRYLKEMAKTNDVQMTSTRDTLLEMMLYSRTIPSSNDIRQQIKRNLNIPFPEIVYTFGYELLLDSCIIGFLLPDLHVYSPYDDKMVMPIKKISVKESTIDSILAYVGQLKTLEEFYAQRYQYESRFRNPFGLGYDVVVSMRTFYEDHSALKYLIAKSFEATDEYVLNRIQARILHMSKVDEKVPKHIELLVRNLDTGRLQYICKVPIITKFSGTNHFLSVVQLKKDIEEELRDLQRLAKIVYMPIQKYSNSEIQSELLIPRELFDLVGRALYLLTGTTTNLAQSCKDFSNSSFRWRPADPQSGIKGMILLYCVPIRQLSSFVSACSKTLCAIADQEEKSNSILLLTRYLYCAYMAQIKDIFCVLSANFDDYFRELMDSPLKYPFMDTILAFLQSMVSVDVMSLYS